MPEKLRARVYPAYDAEEKRSAGAMLGYGRGPSRFALKVAIKTDEDLCVFVCPCPLLGTAERTIVHRYE